MLIFVAYLGHQARLCVSLIENVNCSNEKKKEPIATGSMHTFPQMHSSSGHGLNIHYYTLQRP